MKYSVIFVFNKHKTTINVDNLEVVPNIGEIVQFYDKDGSLLFTNDTAPKSFKVDTVVHACSLSSNYGEFSFSEIVINLKEVE